MPLSLSGSNGISGIDGSASTPALQGSDTNTGVHFPAADTVAIDTGGSERLRIDSSGRCGIGTTSPSTALHVVKDENNSSSYYLDGNATALVSNNNASGIPSLKLSGSSATTAAIVWGGNGSESLILANRQNERARIDSSGRLLLGTSSARTNINNESWSGNVALNVEGANAYGTAVNIVNNYNGNGYSFLNFLKSNTTSIGSNTVVASGDTVGLISFQGNDGTEFVQAAAISAVIDATPGANDMPGRLVFSTTADGASSPTERMRIDSNGFVNVGGYTIPSATPGMQLYGAGNLIFCKRSDTGEVISFYANSTTKVGNIVVGASSTTYNTSSDYRLKENVVPLTGAAERLSQLQVHRFNFITEPEKTVDGFIAHEAQAVVPECVTGEKDAVDDDGNPVYQGIDQSKLVPLLTAALQEALAEIESLKARVTALEP